MQADDTRPCPDSNPVLHLVRLGSSEKIMELPTTNDPSTRSIPCPRYLDQHGLPNEIFDIIIENLVITIGIQKAVLLRTVNHSFNTAIEQAICITQVIDFDDPALCERMRARMPPTLRGKMIALKSRRAHNDDDIVSTSYLSVVARVNRTLDDLIGESPDHAQTKSRHEAVAAQVNVREIRLSDIEAGVDAQNLLSGAVIAGNLTVIGTLLDGTNPSPPGGTTANINGETPYFDRPLALAAAGGDVRVVKYLLDRGARHAALASYQPSAPPILDQSDWNGPHHNLQHVTLYMEPPSALRLAVRGGHDAIVHLLLEPAHRLPATRLEYLSAMAAAACAGRYDLITLLLAAIGKRMSDFVRLEVELLQAAIRYGHADLVRILLDQGADLHVYPGLAYRCEGMLQIAAWAGDVGMVRLLLERGADVNFKGQSKYENRPVNGAARNGHDDVVDVLLEHGADLVEAFYSAVRGGQSRLVKILLGRFPDLPSGQKGEVGRMALVHALGVGNLYIITMLVEAGVSLNEGYEGDDHLPLNLAKVNTIPWVVEHLLSLGARDTDEEMGSGRTDRDTRDIKITERTWEWLGKY